MGKLEELRAAVENLSCPYDERIFPTDLDRAGKYLRKKIGDNDTSAISGTLCRFGWQNAQKAILRIIEEIIEESSPTPPNGEGK